LFENKISRYLLLAFTNNQLFEILLANIILNDPDKYEDRISCWFNLAD